MSPALDRRLFLGSASALLIAPRAAQAGSDLTEPAAIEAHVMGLIQEFLSRISGPKDDLTPTVSVAFTPQLSWISSARPHVMHIAPWEQCPRPVQGFFKSVLAAPSEETAAEFYRAGFYSFLIPHEMSHCIDYERGQGPAAGQRYESELKANRVAVAFWVERSGGRDWLSRFVAQIEDALTRLPVPVPSGDDPAAYFNANYQALLANPVAYAWFQWRMVMEAWARRDEADFATLIQDA